MGSGAKLSLPTTDQAAIQQFLACCTIASFGLGKNKVVDTNYRNALKLESENFTTSFVLASTSILGELQQFLMPEGPHIQVKLNVYCSGGHFKAHVDTPYSPEMFGSLVICLPAQFLGGVLAVRHRGREVQFDWSSSAQKPTKQIQWAAFYSDIEHEVFTVTSGYRITFTYNLYRPKQGMIHVSAVDFTQMPFCKASVRAIGTPHFMRDGGVLGFACQHAYVLTDLNCLETASLKGVDCNVYMAAEAIGLDVSVRPLVKQEYGREGDKYTIPEFEEYKLDRNEYNERDAQLVREVFQLSKDHNVDCTDIVWVCDEHKLEIVSSFSTYAYGNDPGTDYFYQSAAILITKPKWSEGSGTKGNCNCNIA